MNDTIVWDSLAIIEALNDLAPHAGLWPSDFAARAIARAVSAEMHSGFYRLRRDMPMDIAMKNHQQPNPEGALKDAARIERSGLIVGQGTERRAHTFLATGRQRT